jgi:CheY-like chemotaxis protein
MPMATPEQVLIADDDRDTAHRIKAHLEGLGMQVTCVYDGREALDILERETFDRVFLDVMMPFVDGFCVFQRIRQDPAMKATWVAFMTAMTQELDATARIRYGADHYVQKPVVLSDLLP